MVRSTSDGSDSASGAPKRPGFKHFPFVFGLFFLVSVFGCCPLWFIVTTYVLAIYESYEYEWFVENGELLPAVVIDKYIGQSAQTMDHVVKYRVVDPDGQVFEKGEDSKYVYDMVDVGDEIQVWRVGDRFHIDRVPPGYSNLARLIALIPLMLCVIGIPYLYRWYYRRHVAPASEVERLRLPRV